MDGILERNRQLAGKMDESSNGQEMEMEISSGMLVPQIDPQALRLHQGKSRSLLAMERTLSASLNSRLPKTRNEGRGIENQEEVEEDASSTVGFLRKMDADWKFLDRPHGDMAIFSTPQGVVALHCRAAYERIRFEQLEDSLEGEGKSRTQALLLPESLELDGDGSGLAGKRQGRA